MNLAQILATPAPDIEKDTVDEIIKYILTVNTLGTNGEVQYLTSIMTQLGFIKCLYEDRDEKAKELIKNVE